MRKSCLFGYKRRYLYSKIDKSVEIKSDYSFITEGSKLTIELLQVETREDTISNIASYYCLKPNLLHRHYKKKISGFVDWKQHSHAESFNSKIKLFRANQRGVVDFKFFLFRLEKLFA